jgi:hypothetical protein
MTSQLIMPSATPSKELRGLLGQPGGIAGLTAFAQVGAHAAYQSLNKGMDMGKSLDVSPIPWTRFQWLVGGLLLIIAALTGVVWTTISGDVSDIKKDMREVRKDIGDARVELLKAIGGVDKQIGITNQKLDDAELRKKR